MRISDYIFSPALASMMKKRREALFLGGVAASQFALVTFGLPGIVCPFKAAFGIPCPGCGLSTSISFLMHGHLEKSIATHAFGPIFFVGLVFFLAVAILPENWRMAMIDKVAAFEKRTAVTTILMIALMFYWGFRLLKL